MHLDDETIGELTYAATCWDYLGACLRPTTEAERAEAREKGRRAYRARKNDPAFRAANAARSLARYHEKKAAEGKVSKRGNDKKLTAEARAEIVSSSERGVDLARRLGVSKATISWVRKHWRASVAA